MKDKIIQTIERIRNSSPKVKMRWVVALTALTMVLVLFIWVKSIDDLIDINQSNSFLSIETERKNSDESLLHRLRLRTAQTIIYFNNKFKEKNEITITN